MGVGNVDGAVKIQEHCSISEQSAVKNVKPANDKNTDIIIFDVPDKIMLLNSKYYKLYR